MKENKKIKEITNEEEKNLENLINLLKALNIHVKYERGVFNGGYARYKNDKYFYLNRKSKVKTRIALILDELKGMEIPEELITADIKKILPI